MSLGKIYFILVRPQMGENIGSAARAIKNFNIKYLRIVNPRCNWPSQKALATSVGAKDILKSAKIYNSIEKAIGDLDIIFASTSRIRKVNKEIISISKAGEIFSSLESPEIISKIKNVYNNRKELGLNGRKFAKQNNWSEVCKKLIGIYEDKVD